MEIGEELTYTLLFVVDKDRAEDYVLAPAGSNGSFWQGSYETAEEILNGLEGYVRLF